MQSDLADFQKRLEHMLLFQITLNVKEGKISIEDAKRIADLYLQLQANSKEELLQGLIDMKYDYPVIEPVIAVFSKEFDTEFKNTVLPKVHQDIQNGNIDLATQDVKGTT